MDEYLKELHDESNRSVNLWLCSGVYVTWLYILGRRALSKQSKEQANAESLYK